MSPSIQNLNVSLSLDASRRLERMARERGETSEELAALLLEQIILKKGCDKTIRIVQKEWKEGENPDPKGLQEIIRRQDAEISWLREKISRLITLNPPVHIIHHGQNGNTWEQSKDAVNNEIKTEILSQAIQSDESSETEKGESPPPHISEDFSGDNFTQTVESPVYSQDLLSHPSDAERSDERQVSGRTLRDLVGGITGDKQYTLFEAAAIAGEAESVLLEFISDGFLPAVQYQDTYLIRGNDLRNYILSK